MRRALLASAAAAVMVSTTQRSSAQVLCNDSCGGAVAAVVIGYPAATLSLVPLVANIVYIARDRRTIAWPIIGFVFGGLSTAMGVTLLASAVGKDGIDTGAAFAVASPMLGIGVGTLVTSVWALALPAAPRDARFQLVPIARKDATGLSASFAF